MTQENKGNVMQISKEEYDALMKIKDDKATQAKRSEAYAKANARLRQKYEREFEVFKTEELAKVGLAPR